MSFPRYKKYKPSGVEWLGEVPEHWEVFRIANLFNDQADSGNDDLPILSVSIHHGVSDAEIPEEKMDRKVVRSEDRTKYKKVQPGDLVYNMMRAWQGGFGSVSVPGMVSPAYVVARPRRDFETIIVEQQLRTPPAIEQMRRHSRGVTDFRLRLYWEEFKNIQVVVPSASEQTAIATFLERETAKIDELVAEQRRLMELLKEKRQSVISHAVTKGLNPAAPMKPSGIEWLGDVPEHWRAVQVKHLARDGRKTFTDGDWIETPYVTDEGIRLIQTGNIRIGFYNEKGFRYISEETFEDFKCTEVKPRDVLICRLDGPVGRGCLAPDLGVRMITSVDNAILKCADDILPEYIVAIISSVPWLSWIDALCRVGGGFRLRVSRSQLGEIRVPIPPFEEQRAIIEHLKSETGHFDTLTTEAQRAIDLLQERRTALISAAVTGKIDVRNS